MRPAPDGPINSTSPPPVIAERSARNASPLPTSGSGASAGGALAARRRLLDPAADEVDRDARVECGEDGSEPSRDARSRSGPTGRIGLEQLQTDRAQRLGHLRIDSCLDHERRCRRDGDRRIRVPADRIGALHGGSIAHRVGERTERAPEGVQVGAVAPFPAPGLGCEERGGPFERRRPAGRPRQSEVHQAGDLRIVAHDDVGGLDVAVEQSAPVQRGERARDGDPDGRDPGEAALRRCVAQSCRRLGRGAALDVLLDEDDRARLEVPGAGPRLAELQQIVNGGEVGMSDGTEHLQLPHQTRRVCRVDDLERA
ncbi:MAG: hypothetical protein RMK74_06450 [Myxococcales bacterium]|nr:hypothetical protein [Myxococcales bacterium]